MQSNELTDKKTLIDRVYSRGGSAKLKHHRERKAVKTREHTLDKKKILAWVSVGCTMEEISGLVGVSREWLSHLRSVDREWDELFEGGLANFKQSLRLTQSKLALSGHPGMLIWLGKQFLGQSDKQENKTETTVNVVLQNAMKELRDLDSNTLLEMKRLMEKKEPLSIENGSKTSEAVVIES